MFGSKKAHYVMFPFLDLKSTLAPWKYFSVIFTEVTHRHVLERTRTKRQNIFIRFRRNIRDTDTGRKTKNAEEEKEEEGK